MDSFNISVRSPRIVPRAYNLRPVADALAASEKARILRGYNILDQPSKPLSLAYARSKVKAGALAIRNWLRSGAMMSAFGVKTESDDSITVGWSPEQEQKVAWNERRERMAGLSPSDRQAGKEAAKEEFGVYVKDLWTTIPGACKNT